jgi:glycosyltransferase involved in cell wall biosynthesis
LRPDLALESLKQMRIIALLAAYNEERFIGACLENLTRQGCEVVLIDNSSTDATVEIARPYLGRGLIDIVEFPRHGVYTWGPILRFKEELAERLDADWFMHVDADEIRVPPSGEQTLASALASVDGQGYNAVNFMEFCFIPTREEPDHDHPDFQTTMRSYYSFLPWNLHRVNTWKRQPDRVDLATSGGHTVSFPGLRLYPERFPMRHYLFLSVPHAVEKYTGRRYDPQEVAGGWHGWRANVQPEMLELPSRRDLRVYASDAELDPSSPRTTHWIDPARPAADGVRR